MREQLFDCVAQVMVRALCMSRLCRLISWRYVLSSGMWAQGCSAGSSRAGCCRVSDIGGSGVGLAKEGAVSAHADLCDLNHVEGSSGVVRAAVRAKGRVPS